jgi:hypothetical protein
VCYKGKWKGWSSYLHRRECRGRIVATEQGARPPLVICPSASHTLPGETRLEIAIIIMGGGKGFDTVSAIILSYVSSHQ